MKSPEPQDLFSGEVVQESTEEAGRPPASTTFDWDTQTDAGQAVFFILDFAPTLTAPAFRAKGSLPREISLIDLLSVEGTNFAC